MILNTSDQLLRHNPIVTSKGIVHTSKIMLSDYECKIILNKNRKRKTNQRRSTTNQSFF